MRCIHNWRSAECPFPHLQERGINCSEICKACTKCGNRKPLSAFSRHRLAKDGHAHQCKECNAKRGKIWRATPAGVYSQIKGRLNYHKNKPLKTSKEDFIKWYVNKKRVCEYCDISEDKLELLGDSHNSHAKRLTVDCVENSAGYVLGNMVLACHRGNSTKSDMFSHGEMRRLAQQFIKPIWERILECSELS